jgi:hypothetical protein
MRGIHLTQTPTIPCVSKFKKDSPPASLEARRHTEKTLRQAQGREEMLRAFKLRSTHLRQGSGGPAASEIPATRSGVIPRERGDFTSPPPQRIPSRYRGVYFGHGYSPGLNKRRIAFLLCASVPPAERVVNPFAPGLRRRTPCGDSSCSEVAARRSPPTFNVGGALRAAIFSSGTPTGLIWFDLV